MQEIRNGFAVLRLWSRALAGLVAAVCAAMPVSAGAVDGFHLRGFGSLGYTHEHTDDVAFLRDVTQPVPPDRDGTWRSDSILGVQAGYRFSPQWEFATQLVARHREGSSLEDAVEWAYLAWRPTDAFDLRVGRVGKDVFLLSDHRSLGYAQTWVRPPREFYGWIPLYSIDGADLAWRFDAGQTRFTFKTQLGRSSTPFPLTEDEHFDFGADRIRNLSVLAERGPWQLKAALSVFEVDGDPHLDPARAALGGLAAGGFGPISDEAARLGRDLHLDGTTVRYHSLGAAYDDGRWVLQGELARVDADSHLVASGTTGYLSVARRIGAFTPYVSLARFHPSRDARKAANDWAALGADADLLQRRVLAAYNTFRIDQRTLTLGVRWDFADQAALKLQWDRSHVKGHGYGLWQVDNVVGGNEGRRIDVLSISMDFVF
ncbi:hypothetical protein [Pseudazoarcus pumilus]|uniref:Porin n=1 Tax=Pseudazoarcus pumilus TaxID=2067960 RepID=A0A2I6S6V1_9RHOO|nr:hypothetical protein [Pseudazoarcus pumilus]AUN94978.1 hypothetical protein C0099_08535 [Pseudazoarcus pumilus]